MSSFLFIPLGGLGVASWKSNGKKLTLQPFKRIHLIMLNSIIAINYPMKRTKPKENSQSIPLKNSNRNKPWDHLAK
jgi:hypothetical protein